MNFSAELLTWIIFLIMIDIILRIIQINLELIFQSGWNSQGFFC